MSSTEVLVKHLKEAGLRVTPQRVAIYRALTMSDAHPTAHDLYEQLQSMLPSLSQSTVYNTLRKLVAHGLIQEIGTAGDGAVHYDAELNPHINLICTRCHRVEDFFDDIWTDVDKQVAAQSGYELQGMRIAFYGLCPGCR